MAKGNLTRINIIHKAFELIYKKGYQSTSLEEILASTAVTKGSLYHHFKNKEDMGLAVIKEVLYPEMYEGMIKPLLSSKHATKDIYEMMEGLLIHNSFFNVKYGCPAVNLIDEMASINQQFSQELKMLIMEWKQAIVKSIEGAKAEGLVKSEVKPEQVATFVVSGYSGVRNIGKITGSVDYKIFLKELQNYLQALEI